MNPLLGKCPLCILRNEIRSVILLGVLFDTFVTSNSFKINLHTFKTLFLRLQLLFKSLQTIKKVQKLCIFHISQVFMQEHLSNTYW